MQRFRWDEGKVPLLKRLFWPLLAVPCAVAAAMVYAGARAGVRPAWLLGALLLPVLFGALYASLWRASQLWGQPPAGGVGEEGLAPPHPPPLVGRGGRLTPGCASFFDPTSVLVV